MALWPLAQGGRMETNGADASTAISTTVTGSASAHTKGAWSQVIASTGGDVNEIVLWSTAAIAVSGSDSSTLLDIGIGGSGSETVIVPDLNLGGTAAGHLIRVPVFIPGGSRVSLRLQSAITSKTYAASVALIGGAGWGRRAPTRRATTYGANSATSGGVTIDDPGASNTDGAWTEITSSTTTPARWLLPFLSGPVGNAAWTSTNGLADVAIGASGSEVIIAEHIPTSANAAEQLLYPALVLPVSLPAGTRIAMRHRQATGTGVGIAATVTTID